MFAVMLLSKSERCQIYCILVGLYKSKIMSRHAPDHIRALCVLFYWDMCVSFADQGILSSLIYKG